MSFILIIAALLCFHFVNNLYCFSQSKFPFNFEMDSSDFIINSMDFNEVNEVLAFGGQAASSPFIGLYSDASPLFTMSWMYHYQDSDYGLQHTESVVFRDTRNVLAAAFRSKSSQSPTYFIYAIISTDGSIESSGRIN